MTRLILIRTPPFRLIFDIMLSLDKIKEMLSVDDVIRIVDFWDTRREPVAQAAKVEE